MVKKILISFFSLFFMFSCSGGGETVEESVLKKYEGNGYNIDIPSVWEIKDLTDTGVINLPKPKEGKLEMVVSAKEEQSGFINNLIVLSMDLESETDSYSFIKKNNPKNYNGYEYYYEDTAKDFEFSDGDKSRLYIFLAKYNKDNDKLKFMQTAKICGEKKVFFLTMGLSLNINDTAKYEEIFRSFKCD